MSNNIQTCLANILQKNIKITLNNNTLREGKFILFNIKDFYIQFLIETPITRVIKTYEIPVPFDVQITENTLLFHYTTNKVVKRDEKCKMHLNILLSKCKKPSKLYDNTVMIVSQ